MSLKSFKPTTPSNRYKVLPSFDEITKSKPEKSLLQPIRKSGGRNNMTIRTSHDDGQTWNEGYLYDSRQCMGYSCIAMTDDKHVGIIYETCHNNGKNGNRGIGFIRIPLETVVTGKEVPAKPAQIGGSNK